MTDYIFDFIGGDSGPWKVTKMNTLKGLPLEKVSHIKRQPNSILKSNEGTWALKGVISNLRYTEKGEKEKLIALQEDIGRASATHMAMIPMRKSESWWALAQDERRKIFENKSHHTQTGLKYLPEIARKLYHSRDLGEPFDFITFFEFKPEHANYFDELLGYLRSTEEWTFVDREIDIRMIRV